MSTGALIMAIGTQVVFIVVTGFFFYKVLTIKPNPEPDSFNDNDEESNWLISWKMKICFFFRKEAEVA